MRPLQTYLLADDTPHLFYQPGIEGCGLPYAGGKYRCADGHVPVGGFFGQEYRNAQTGVFYRIFL